MGLQLLKEADAVSITLFYRSLVVSIVYIPLFWIT